MFYFILGTAALAGSYFTFRYFLLLSALRSVTAELQEIREDLTQNQILHLPVPNRTLAALLRSVNDTLEAIQRERQKYEKREREFQRQIENISHDLRTPLTVILGYLKLIKSQDLSPSADGAELKAALESIGKKAEVLNTLVTQFYDFSRLSADDYELSSDRVDISGTLRESLAENAPLLEQANLDVTVSIPGHPVFVMADEAALERIFLNLLQNAGRYAKTRLSVFVREGTTDVSVLFVNDTKMLSEEDPSRLFERFYMQDAARSRGGTGLGLNVAKILAEQMGGTLRAKKADGEWEDLPLGCSAIRFELSMKIIPNEEETR